MLLTVLLMLLCAVVVSHAVTFVLCWQYVQNRPQVAGDQARDCESHLLAQFPSADRTCAMLVVQAAEALRRAKFKFPGRQKVVASRNW